MINSDRPFSEEQRALLELLLPHIQQAHNLAERLAAYELERTHGGRLTERDTLTCDGEGRFATLGKATLAVLREFFPEPRAWPTDRQPPEAVARWAREELGRFLRSPSLARPVADLVARGPGGVLRLAAHPDFRRRWQTVSLHVLRPVGRPSSAVMAARLGLTPREGEVLHWVAEGKRNAEIAVILGTAPGTVRKQVASILTKLDAETRGAAAAHYARAADGGNV